MVHIRREQRRAFFFAMSKPFIRRAEDHLRAAFPERRRELGDEAVRASIDHCLERGWDYEIEEDDLLLLYLDVMYTLGLRFDEDPRYPWAREILSDPELSPDTRVELLTQRAAIERRAPGA